MPYSQSNEEGCLKEIFRHKKDGCFLDIGAYDGKAFSNTYRLVEDGWSGVCVEPSPTVIRALYDLHLDNPRISVVQAAVVSPGEEGLVPFWDSGGDAISTTDTAHRDKWAAGWNCKFSKIWVAGITISQLFETFDQEFDFINIDTEGTSYKLFCELPMPALTKTRLKVICVEHDNQVARIEASLKQFGFVVKLMNGENLIMAR